jgi:hypothetical protein
VTAHLLAWFDHLSPDARYFAWQYFRALVWVVAVSLALWRATGNAKVARAFFLAHLLALGFGVAVDAFMVNWAPKAWLQLDVLEWVFVAPIAIFTVISLWIGSWQAPVHASDAFMALAPIVAWGFLVIYGWQTSMWHCHVLGAWFVSAACGGVDLYARYGAVWARRRPYAARSAAYAIVVMIVYLLLPRTEMGL